VASQFLSRGSEGLEVNHKDGNKLNNKLDNLEWITKEENIRHYLMELKIQKQKLDFIKVYQDLYKTGCKVYRIYPAGNSRELKVKNQRGRLYVNYKRKQFNIKCIPTYEELSEYRINQGA
jgi:hypothetical protein